jgi:2-C-methyl-D-erythritol 4-phosphate cytidylyltransferase
VHPLTSRVLVESVVQAAERAGAAAAVNRLNDFVLGADTVVQARPAMAYLQVKPIVFRVESIRLGLARVDAGHVLQGPGEPGVIELLRLAGDLPELVEAEPWNIKLTTERDWRMIQALEASGVPARRE